MSSNPFSNSEFRFFLSARFLITLNIQIQSVVVGWQIYQLTGDPLALGLIGLTEAIPAIGVALFAGHLADHSVRRRIVLSAYTLLFICSVSLWIFTLNGEQILKIYGTFPVYAAVFLTGLARGFQGPSVFALLSEIIRREELGKASALSTTAWQTAAVGGPAVAGLLYGFFGGSWTYGLNIFLVSGAFLSVLMIRSRPVPVHDKKMELKESLFSGIRFVFGNQMILSAISLDLFAVLFGGAVALLPVFASEILSAGPEGLGILRAAPAVGSVVVALWLAKNPVRKKAGKLLLVMVALFGMTMIGFGLSTWFWLSLLLLFLSGIFDGVSVVIRATIMQLYTPDSMKGRVSAVNSIFIGSSNEIGAFESGLAARILGLVPSVVFGGLMTLGVVGVTAWKARELRNLDLY
ncbi:MAG: MFS transporter [Bacteroidetes bacterium]|nr:MFS transporter [Bacteroidota bacterium]